MRSISSRSTSILSLNRASFDCFASPARNLPSAFSTESLLISAMITAFLERRKAKRLRMDQEVISPGLFLARGPDEAASPSSRIEGGATQPHRRRAGLRGMISAQRLNPAYHRGRRMVGSVDLGQASMRSSSKAVLGC
jgi:hypothetical protein